MATPGKFQLRVLRLAQVSSACDRLAVVCPFAGSQAAAQEAWIWMGPKGPSGGRPGRGNATHAPRQPHGPDQRKCGHECPLPAMCETFSRFSLPSRCGGWPEIPARGAGGLPSDPGGPLKPECTRTGVDVKGFGEKIRIRRSDCTWSLHCRLPHGRGRAKHAAHCGRGVTHAGGAALGGTFETERRRLAFCGAASARGGGRRSCRGTYAR